MTAEGDYALQDHNTYRRVGQALRIGLIVSIAVMIIGFILEAVRSAGGATHVLPIQEIMPHLARLDPPAILDLGILLLFATPLVGVLVALIEFMRRRDVPFALIAGSLVVVLVIGFAVALH